MQKFLTNFTYNTQSWKEYINHEQSNDTDSDPITLRQLASHMSGIGRDLPAENYDSWPPQNPSGVPSVLPTLQGELESVAQLPLIAPSYSFPAYSNTGFSILGASLAAADNSTYTGIVARDVFTPLAMNGSSFYVTDQNRAQLAIPRDGTEIVCEQLSITFYTDYSPRISPSPTLSTLLEANIPPYLILPKRFNPCSPPTVKQR